MDPIEYLPLPKSGQPEGADVVAALRLLGVTIAALVIFGFGVTAGEIRGLSTMTEVAASSIEREEHSRKVLARLLHDAELAMAVVAREDSALHQQIHEEVPGWQDIAGITQAYLVETLEGENQ